MRVRMGVMEMSRDLETLMQLLEGYNSRAADVAAIHALESRSTMQRRSSAAIKRMNNVER